MAFDPVAKMAKLNVARKIARATRRKPAKPGPLSNVEKSIVAEIVNATDLSPAQEHALAITLNKPVDTIRTTIEAARADLESHARNYVQAHKKVIDRALEMDTEKSLEVARRGSQWAMEKISGKSSDGKTVRVIDADVDKSSNMPAINIGIALGGLPRAQSKS